MTRYSEKTKEELIWSIWKSRNPAVNHEDARMLYKASLALELPMTSIIEALAIYEACETPQDDSDVVNCVQCSNNSGPMVTIDGFLTFDGFHSIEDSEGFGWICNNCDESNLKESP